MTVEQYAEFCEKCHKADKDAKDLLLQAYKRGVEEGKGYLEQIRWERDVAISQLEDIGASCGLNMSLWLTEHDKEVIRKFTESLKQEIDYLNENGGGIGDLYFWLKQIKEGEEDETNNK